MNDTNMMENNRLEQNALKLSIVGAAVMAALGMFFAVLTRSEAIMLDGLFSLIAFAMGIVFAAGWSPCVGPILSGILTVAASRETVLQGVGLLAVYSAGLAVPFLLTGWSIEYFFRFFDRMKHHFRKLEVVSGTLLVAIGVLVVTDQLTRLNNYFVFLNRIVAALEETLL